MHDKLEKFPDWDRNTRAPVPLPPPNSCDCQVHVYGDPAEYPPKPDLTHVVPDATFDDAQRVLKTLGLERAVLVHPTVYETDYRLLIDNLSALPDRANYRGVVILNDTVTDTEIARLQTLGVCGARFHIAARYKPVPKDALRHSLDRLRELGWHARLHLDPPDWLKYADVLTQIKDVPMVIDHMGRLDFSQGPTQPAFKWLLDRLKNDGWWMMVSNGNRMSRMESGWEDAIPFAKAYIDAAPDRTIWATDWPHVRWRKTRMMNDAEVLELLYRYVDADQELLKQILVKNPAKLHGFPY